MAASRLENLHFAHLYQAFMMLNQKSFAKYHNANAIHAGFHGNVLKRQILLYIAFLPDLERSHL